MRRIIVFLILFFCYGFVFAQNQAGVVRDAGTSRTKGVGLAGVQIRAEGSNATESAEDGSFSVMLQDKTPGDSFLFTKIFLKGYELLEKDGLRKIYIHSQEVPVEIVMISTEQLRKAKAKIMEKARKNAERMFKNEEDDLNRRLKKQKLSIEDYQVKIDSLNKRMEVFEYLLPDMAEHYARTDYDRLDSLNKEINNCIVNGELERADSLINTKGDVLDRARSNIQKGAKIAVAEQDLQKAKDRVNSNREALGEEKKRIDESVRQQKEIEERRNGDE